MNDPIKAIPTPKVMIVVIAGERFPLRFTNDALHDLETFMGGSVFDFIHALINGSWPAVKMSHAARVLWSGCAHMGRSAPTVEECFNALATEGASTSIMKLLEPLVAYVNGASDETEDEGEEAEGEKKQ